MRTVLVTGASSGIGRSICLNLLDQGAQVIAIARDFSKFPDAYDKLYRYEIDLADLPNLPQALAALAKTHDAIEAVVCSAGRGQFGSLEEFSYSQIQQLINLNFTAHAYVTRALLPLMKKRARADLVFIGSEAALWGGRRGAVYSASKAALRGFAQALRDECARSGVRVCIINPGMVRTEFFEQLVFAPGDSPDNAVLPEEVAQAVSHVLNARDGVVFDEINLSPLKKVLKFER